MQIKSFSYQAKKIVYRTNGEGPIVVLLHGFGEEGSVWKGQYNLFPQHQLIVPDLPGSGESEAIDDMSMEGMADVVMAIVKDAAPPPPKGGHSSTQPIHVNDSASNIEFLSREVRSEAVDNPSLGGRGADICLIGHSMGGYITLAFAEKYPDTLSGFGLFHSTTFADSEEKKENRRKGIRFIQENGAQAFLKTATPALYAPQTRELYPEWIEEHLYTVRNFRSESLVSYYTAMIERPDRTNILQQSGVPVLFVMGRHDTAVPLTDGLVQCHLPQVAFIHILEHSGHMGMKEELNEASQILSQFVITIEKTA